MARDKKPLVIDGKTVIVVDTDTDNLANMDAIDDLRALRLAIDQREPVRQDECVPRGIYVLTNWSAKFEDGELQPSIKAESSVWRSDFVKGVTVRIYWKDLQPSKGKQLDKSSPGWTKLAYYMGKAVAHQKRLRLMIGTGVYSPQWLIGASDLRGPTGISDEGVGLFEGDVLQGDKKGEGHAYYPVPWDKRYEMFFSRFLDKLFAALDSSHAVYDRRARVYTEMIDWFSVTGPGSHNGEVVHLLDTTRKPNTEDEKPKEMPRDWDFLVECFNPGESFHDLWTGAWKKALRKFDERCGPRKIYYTLAFTYNKSYPAGGVKGNYDTDWRFKKDLIEYAKSLPNGRYFGVQTNGLDDRIRPAQLEKFADYPGSKRHWRLVYRHGRDGGLAGFQTRGMERLYGTEKRKDTPPEERAKAWRRMVRILEQHNATIVEIYRADAEDEDPVEKGRSVREHLLEAQRILEDDAGAS